MPASIKHLKLLFSKDKLSIVLFAKWPENNLYYLVNLLKLDEKKERCSVKYEDGTECWVSRRDVHLQFQTELPDEDDIFCCLCEKDESEEPNEIIVCDVCQQGFHQECHEPHIRQVGDDTQEWFCQTCSYIMKQLDPMPNTSTPKIKKEPRVKKESPRRALLKASKAKQSRIKLTRDREDKKSSQESVKSKTSARIRNQEAEQAKPVEPSNSPPPPELVLAETATHDNRLVSTAKKLIDSIGTNDFVDAIAHKAEPEAKATNGKTNGKAPKKAATKKAAKAPAPA